MIKQRGDIMNISDSIRVYRTLNRMTQQELGKALGVTAQAVSKYECGLAEPDSSSIMKMCDMFGVSADELLGRTVNGRKETPPALDDTIIDLLVNLPADQLQRVKDFVAGLKAATK